MVLWCVVGFTVWILCVLFMLAVIKGGHRNCGHECEQRLCQKHGEYSKYQRFDVERSEEDYKNKKESMSDHIHP